MKERIVKIQLTKPAKSRPISWLIMKITGRDYSHVRFFWHGVNGSVPIVYEASGSYLKFIGPIAEKQKPVKIVKEFEYSLDRLGYRKLVKFCMTNAGVQYGRLQLIGMALAQFFKLKKNPFGDGRKTQVCSELAFYFFKDVMGWDVSSLDPDTTDPGAIEDYLNGRKRAS
jgi:hypothetical protein